MRGSAHTPNGQPRRVWRAAPATLAAVSILAVAAAAGVSGLAFLIYRQLSSPWIPAALGVLTLAALVYAWRFGLHPRLVADESSVEVVNPFHRFRFEWDDITVIAPGENGLVIGATDRVAEAWCVQKSNWSLRRGRFTRADEVAHQLIDLLEQHDPPLEDAETGLRIRRARPDESRTLTRIERAASEEHLEHLFPPVEYPYPVAQVTARWRRLLREPTARVYVLDHQDEVLGFVTFSRAEVLHLGVVPHRTRLGYGSALLEFACREIYDSGETQAVGWVLEGNLTARAFSRSHGWVETAQRRLSPRPPRPEEMRLTKANPVTPRRSR